MALHDNPVKRQPIADELIGETCTLIVDGKKHKAKVMGRLNRFATIGPFNPDIPTVEYAWETVQRIMQSTKVFNA